MERATKDEKFIMCLYKSALGTDDMQTAFSKYEIGQQAGITAKGVDAICKLLLQANFIKKSGETDVYITERGQQLAKELIEENS